MLRIGLRCIPVCLGNFPSYAPWRYVYHKPEYAFFFIFTFRFWLPNTSSTSMSFCLKYKLQLTLLINVNWESPHPTVYLGSTDPDRPGKANFSLPALTLNRGLGWLLSKGPVKKYMAQESAYLDSSILLLWNLFVMMNVIVSSQKKQQRKFSWVLTPYYFVVLLFSKKHEYLIIRNFIILNGLYLIMKYEYGFTPMEHN